MRLRALLLALALAACGHDSLPGPGGGNADLAGGGGGGTADLSDGRSCAGDPGCSSGGVACFSVCCNPGEWCDPSTRACRCGSGPACDGGKVCASGGPIQPGGNECGSICCGGGTPCPL